LRVFADEQSLMEEWKHANRKQMDLILQELAAARGERWWCRLARRRA
jgi:hypothetical protein